MLAGAAAALGGVARAVADLARNPGLCAVKVNKPASGRAGPRALRLSAALFVAFAAGAAGPPAAAAPPLWRAVRGERTVYVFGSVHLLGPDRAWETPALDRALATSDELWLELPDPDDRAAAGAFVQAHGLDPSRGLRRALDPPRVRALSRELASIGAPADALDGMRPWLAALTLSVAPLQRAGFETGEGVDRVVKRDAEARGEPVRGFETMESQLALLSDLPDPLQVAFLDDAIDGFPKALGDIRAIRAAWMAGDDARLYALMRTGTPTAVFDRLFTERNGVFAAAIDARVRSGPGRLLVVVGAGHLVGPEGLIARLKALGFTVSRD